MPAITSITYAVPVYNIPTVNLMIESINYRVRNGWSIVSWRVIRGEYVVDLRFDGQERS